MPTELRDTDYKQAGAVLRVLGHADRLRLIDLLMREEMPVAELARRTQLAPNAVSQHLNHMLAHGILSRQRRGRCVYYQVTHVMAKNLLRCMWRNTAT